MSKSIKSEVINNKTYEYIEDQNGRRRPIIDGRVVLNNSLAENPMAELRREALLVLGYDPDWKGEIKTPNEITASPGEVASLEQCLGRCLLRCLNKTARYH